MCTEQQRCQVRQVEPREEEGADDKYATSRQTDGDVKGVSKDTEGTTMDQHSLTRPTTSGRAHTALACLRATDQGDRGLGHEAGLTRLHRLKSYSALFYKNGTQMEISHRKTTGKPPNTRKLKQQTSKLATSHKISLKGKQYIELKEKRNENIRICGTQLKLRTGFIALNACNRKDTMSQFNI